jgi:hypothetical protein
MKTYTIDVEDVLNAIYNRTTGDRPIQWENEGCGDDERDGRKLAIKHIKLLLEIAQSEGYAEGQKAAYERHRQE